MPNPFLDSLWPGLTVWILLYISDYAMTLNCARLYRAGANEKIAFEGSYELNPQFQRDIDALRRVSPRFVAFALLSTALLVALWFLTTEFLREFYYFALGSMVLMELAIHMRHLRNFFLFRAINGTDAVRGRIEYSRAALLQMSATEFYGFAALFVVLFAFTRSWFVLGGATACLSLAVRHRKLFGKRPPGQAATAPPPQGTQPSA